MSLSLYLAYSCKPDNPEYKSSIVAGGGLNLYMRFQLSRASANTFVKQHSNGMSPISPSCGCYAVIDEIDFVLPTKD